MQLRVQEYIPPLDQKWAGPVSLTLALLHWASAVSSSANEIKATSY